MTENIYVKAANAIPKGQTRCYAEVAILAGKPKAARAAGRVLTSCPAEDACAWQRAVSMRGSLSIDPERAKVQLERLQSEGARPREDESVLAWAKRVRTPFVGDYRSRTYVERDHPRVARFDPRYVERIASDAHAVERYFEHFDDRALRMREDAEVAEARARRKPATKTRKKAASR